MIHIAGHMGELLQGRIGDTVALVTLPCPVLGVTAQRRAGPFALHGVIPPVWGRRVLAAAGLPVTGRFLLRASMPVGGGAGSSTAALIAVARLAGLEDPATLAAAAHMVEGASDPLMWTDPARLLWAPRKGRILGRLPPPPRMDVIGGFYGPPRRTNPADTAFPDIADLVARWPAACADPAAFARLVSEGAARNVTAADPTPAVAAQLGALGWGIAHTGSARFLLFPAGKAPPPHALHAAGFTGTVGFRLGGRACS